MGTANLLEALRGLDTVRAVVVVTTDKVYGNQGRVSAYRETDPLGGYDPYSSSKAAAEILTTSYRSSFFSTGGLVNIATARACNVIGGGDWAKDRLVPDCLRAFDANEPVQLRYPNAVRPWQHVLEPLSGYLKLAETLREPGGEAYAGAWNFGPGTESDAMVIDVAEATGRLWGDGAKVEATVGEAHPHEADVLRLDTTRSRTVLGWMPRWNLQQALRHTVGWHRAWQVGEDMRAFTLRQIDLYRNR